MLEVNWKANGKQITAVYQGGGDSGYTVKDLEEQYGECDQLQLWYPKRLCADIAQKWGNIVSIMGFREEFGDNSATIVINLQNDLEVIFNDFKKNTRYEIRRAAERDNVKFESLLNPTMSELYEYERFHNDFSDIKGISHVNIEKTKALVEQGSFVLTRILDENNTILAMHAYIYEKGVRAALTTSASIRLEDVDKNKLGRVNRLLHYEDIKFFKSIGTEIYDFGGIHTKNLNEEFASVAKFKASFGGEIEYSDISIIIPMSDILNINKNIKKYKSRLHGIQKKIVVYGCNNTGRYSIDLLKEAKISISYIIDNNSELSEYYGCKIYPDNMLESCSPNDTVIICNTSESTFYKLYQNKWKNLGYELGNTLFALRLKE